MSGKHLHQAVDSFRAGAAAPIIGIGTGSFAILHANTHCGNYALACCKVLRDDEAPFCMLHRPRRLLGKLPVPEWCLGAGGVPKDAEASLSILKATDKYSSRNFNFICHYVNVYCYLPPKILSRADADADNGRRALHIGKGKLRMYNDIYLLTAPAQQVVS
uniref:SFRICE_004646 n=1 Tax=Spodoptera frugiperda TaxID=7108 RepID=A0A2H1WPY5_SPOFR